MRHCFGPAAAAFALACALLLVGRTAVAADGLVVDKSGGGALTATMYTDGGDVIFAYYDHCGNDSNQPPCFAFLGTLGTGGVPVVPGPCKGREGAPSGIECPAAGVTSVTIVLAKSGGISTEQGGRGHHDGQCSPVPVTFHAKGPVGNLAVADGCTEIIDCTGSQFAAVEADRSDVVKSSCTSVQRF